MESVGKNLSTKVTAPLVGLGAAAVKVGSDFETGMSEVKAISGATEVDNYLSLSFCRSYHSPGEFQLVTNRKVQNADRLESNNLIMLGADKYKTAIIRHKEIKEEILTVKGYTLGTITRQRITIPPVGEAHDIQDADVETVMKHYVQRNCLEIVGMEFPMLAIAENKNRGPAVSRADIKTWKKSLRVLVGLPVWVGTYTPI